MLFNKLNVECAYCRKKFDHINIGSASTFQFSEEEFNEISDKMDKQNIVKCPNCGNLLNLDYCRITSTLLAPWNIKRKKKPSFWSSIFSKKK